MSLTSNQVVCYKVLGSLPILLSQEDVVNQWGNVTISDFAWRTAEVIVVLFGLAILGIPMLLVAFAIVLESPGPALFKQNRVVGIKWVRRKNGKRKPVLIVRNIFKFRTFQEKHCRANCTAKDLLSPGMLRRSPQLTRLGPILRWLRIDELPQLINILLGHISIIDPRVKARRIVTAHLKDKRLRRYANRFYGKQGVFSIAAAYRLGDERGLETLFGTRYGLRMDMLYIKNRSLWLNIKVVVWTMRSFLHWPPRSKHLMRLKRSFRRWRTAIARQRTAELVLEYVAQ